MRGNENAEAVAKAHPDLSTTSISCAEFFLGAYRTGSPKLIQLAQDFISHFVILDFDFKSSLFYAEIVSELQKKGQLISSFDELIAATVLRYQEELLTRDKHFARITQLIVKEY
jgi:predicted nucleic acid-binding protein